jgi:Ca-activated chloride channel family protein
MQSIIPVINSIAEAWWDFCVMVGWQSAAVFVLLACLVFLLRKAPAATRYAVWALFLLKLLMPPISLSLSTRTEMAPLNTSPELVTTQAQTSEKISGVSDPSVSSAEQNQTAMPGRTDHPTGSIDETITPVAQAKTHLTAQLFLAWLSMVLLLSALFLRKWLKTQRAINEATPVADQKTLSRILALAQQIGLKRKIQVFTHPALTSPVVAGIRRPRLVLPRSDIFQRLSRSERDCVVLHELAHVHRNDLALHYIALAVQVLYFWNPLVWIVNAALRREREFACDEYALFLMRGQRKALATGLLKLLEFHLTPSVPSPAYLGIANTRKALATRLLRIHSPVPMNLGRQKRRTIALLGLLGLIVLPNIWALEKTITISPHDEGLNVSVRLDRSKVMCNRENDVYLHIQLSGMPVRAQERQPLNLCLVLDKSGSMNADNKWGYLRIAVEKVVRTLTPQDRLAIITYDSDVRTVQRPEFVEEPERILAGLNRFSPSGTTNLYGGLERGCQLLQDYVSDDRVTRVILVSDGLANVGRSDPSDLRWLASRYCEKGIYISTVAVGNDFYHDMMVGIAEASLSNFYFVESPDAIEEAVGQELQGALNVAARDIKVEIELPHGVVLKEALDKEITIRDGRIIVTFPDLYSHQQRNVTLRLRVAKKDENADLRVAKVTVRYEPTAEPDCTRRFDYDRWVSFVDSALEVEASRDRDVLARLALLQSAAIRQQAYDLIKQKRYEEAAEVMQKEIKMLEKAADSYGSQALKDQLNEAQQKARHSIQYNPRTGSYVYDPTNGTVSPGDVYRVKQ